MSGHLCLKWNNHSLAFLKSITKIQSKERFCDATIVCQRKYFSVHRVVLSTCSEYFNEIFEQIQCQHPYVVFKDIESREMELLLNYMYHGEVNVQQESLPALIKAAEALRIKGLAVPDDIPASKEISYSRRRIEEGKRKRIESSDLTTQSTDEKTYSQNFLPLLSDASESRMIKEEPLDPCNYEEEKLLTAEATTATSQNESKLIKEDKNDYAMNFAETESSHVNIRTEDELPVGDSFEEQSSAWSGFESSSSMGTLPHNELTLQDDILAPNQSETNSSTDTAYIPTAMNVLEPFRPEIASHGLMTECLQQCPISHCYYKSREKKTLREHLRSAHFGERPHACPVCPKRFRWKRNCDIHMRIHTGVKPYKCPYCAIQFRHRYSLTRHLNKKELCSEKSYLV